MGQESRENVLCFFHQAPLAICPDDCPNKQSPKSMTRVSLRGDGDKALTLPIIDERAVAEAHARQQADLARIAKVRAEQEVLLAKAKSRVLEDDPEKPKKE